MAKKTNFFICFSLFFAITRKKREFFKKNRDLIHRLTDKPNREILFFRSAFYKTVIDPTQPAQPRTALQKTLRREDTPPE